MAEPEIHFLISKTDSDWLLILWKAKKISKSCNGVVLNLMKLEVILLKQNKTHVFFVFFFNWANASSGYRL